MDAPTFHQQQFCHLLLPSAVPAPALAAKLRVSPHILPNPRHLAYCQCLQLESSKMYKKLTFPSSRSFHSSQVEHGSSVGVPPACLLVLGTRPGQGPVHVRFSIFIKIESRHTLHSTLILLSLQVKRQRLKSLCGSLP